ncbi:MAG: hypothetical protein CMQ29_07675 [Gammaproteobacteria bacterium]|nr:hypothetical protein [Gammaproteobacteria bacterium]|tara:strand:+ start:167 stop:1111 length:945 start_codon:yes stop_codon:yes gene_type:complete
MAIDYAALPEAAPYEPSEIDHDLAYASDGDIAHFKAQGFFVKRGLLDDLDSLSAIRRYMWARVPRQLMREDDPDSWLAKPHRKWNEEDACRVGLLSRGSWKMRSRTIGTETFLVDATARHPRLRAIAARLIGLPLRPTVRVRGVYCILPRPPGVEGYLGPHTDDQSAQLGAMVLIDDVPPRCGGFTLWPGTHHNFRPHWTANVGGRIVEKEAYEREVAEVLANVTPVEITGKAGDVVFWHGRMMHSAGINHSAVEGNRPVARLVVPCDFQRGGKTWYDDDERGPGDIAQWWIDTRNFREDPPPTQDNIWHDWAI